MGKSELTRPISAEDVEEIRGIQIDMRSFSLPDGLAILDVGAGGDAVIFQCLEQDIVGLESAEEEMYATKDKRIEEIVGAQINWIQGDAREMPLDDAQFDAVTSFFTCMYIREPEDKQRLFRECHRVLKDGGILYMWDFSITTDKQVFVGHLDIHLRDDKTIPASYGIGGEMKDQTVDSLISYAEKAGFVCQICNFNDPDFYLEFRKGGGQCE